jgi:hypothetical protein
MTRLLDFGRRLSNTAAGTGLGTTEDIEAYYAGQRSVALIPRVKSPFEFAGINYI